jgi:hypothetical protein
MITEHIRTYKRGAWEVKIDLVDFCEGSPWLRELYTVSDKHIAGTTIQVPDHLQGRNCPKYYIGQYKPSELAKDYAEQGRENPSREAYASLQKELAHYIQASDCVLQATVSRAGIDLGEAYSVGFDISPEYYAAPEEHAKRIRGDYGHEFVSEAIKQARETLATLCDCEQE